MEILRWAFLVGIERRSARLFTAAVAGLCVVAFLVALCAKSVVSKREVTVSSPSGRWKAMRSKMLSAVRKGAFRRSAKDDEGEVSFLGEAEEGRRISVATPPPLWQKKIIMGERCELPTFSGLILYDEKGNALPHASRKTTDFR